jgi:poly-gamma-glutamate capsule biosynthesis protein CapA/YwtB (metallophosphatase superfamily)
MFTRIIAIFSSIFFITAFALSGEAPILTENKSKITIGWVGDMVPSLDTIYNDNAFIEVTDLLSKPDLMIGNLEGTFAHSDRLSKCEYLKNSCHAFRGEANFADALKNAGFDFISLVNNHSYDFGDEGLADTMAELDRVGIAYVTSEVPSKSIVVGNKNIGILGLSSTQPWKSITDIEFIKKEVMRLKSENDFVIVLFHGGAEGSDKSAVTGEEEWVGNENRGNVELVAHTAIDAGADLVLGSGPHVLRKIEKYKSGVIAYSLGNFVGANRLVSKGVLAYSGIFTATLKENSETKYDFQSILLSPLGIPYIDTENISKTFLESLK